MKIHSAKQFIVWVALAVSAGSYISGAITDPDLWWHITVGRWILAHGEIPTVDYWNRFGVGEPWRAYSWSIESIFAAVDLRFGLYGLLVTKIILGGSLALLACFVFARLAQDWFIGLLLGVIVVAACHDHFTLRPQSFVWLYLLALLLVANSICNSGASWRCLASLVVIMSLWANAQITAIFGIFVATAWVMPAQISKLSSQWQRPALVLGACFLGTLITPYFGGEWLTFFSKSDHPMRLSAIAEFQPATILQFPTAFLVLLVALLLTLLIQAQSSFHLWRALAAGALTLAALAVVKFVPFAVIVLGALCATTWANGITAHSAAFGNLGEAVKQLRRTVLRIPSEGLAFVLLVMVAVNVYQVWQHPLNHSVIPVQAVDFMQRNNLAGPILNDFGRGGYLMYRYSDLAGVPSELVSIDGRTNVGKPEVWDEYLAAENGALNWRDYFKRVNPQTVLWRKESPLVSILLERSEWCLVHESRAVDARRKRQDDSSYNKRGYVVFVSKEQFLNRVELESTNCSRE